MAGRNMSPANFQPPGPIHSPRLYVGNLSWNIRWQELKEYMKRAGNVIKADVMEEPSGRSKGCGIVTFATMEEAQHAVNTLNNTELDGRLIFLREDKVGEGSGHQTGEPGSSVYVGNLSWQVKWQDLKDHMKKSGHVVRATVMEEPGGGKSKGCGIVEYATKAEAEKAITELNDSDLMGRLIFVRADQKDVRGTNAPRREYTPRPQHHDSWNGQQGGYGGGQQGGYDSYPQSGGYNPMQPPQYNISPGGPAYGGNSHFGGGQQQYPNQNHSYHHGGGHGGHQHAPSSSGGQFGGFTKLYVGNLDWSVTWQDLKDAFKSCGTVVRADVIMEQAGGRSKGFGVVEFANCGEAAMAIARLNNAPMKGRPMFVRIDLRENGQMPFNQNNRNPNKIRVFAGNLSWNVRWQDLKDHFKTALPEGTDFHASVVMEPGTNNTRSKGFGVVEFNTQEEADHAIATLNGTMLMDREINVRMDGKQGGQQQQQRQMHQQQEQVQQQHQQVLDSPGVELSYAPSADPQQDQTFGSF